MPDVDPVIMQVDEYDEDVNLPPLGTKAVSYGFSHKERQDQEKATFAGFSRDVLGSSSAEMSDDTESDIPQGRDTIVVTRDMCVVQVDQRTARTYDQIIATQGFAQVASDEDVHTTPISKDVFDSPGVAPNAWSSTFAQARKEALQLQAMEEHFRWMTEADQYMLQSGLEPVPWDHFGEAVSQKGETQLQSIEQRASMLRRRWKQVYLFARMDTLTPPPERERGGKSQGSASHHSAPTGGI
jgi:hypothetical protein